MAAPSQTLPMVDGGWGVLQDPNTIWIGHHLGFRAFGLSAGSDRGGSDNRTFKVLYLSLLRNAISRQTEWIPARGHVARVQESICFLMRRPTAAVKGTKPYPHAHRSTCPDHVSERTVRPSALKTKRQPMPLMLGS